VSHGDRLPRLRQPKDLLHLVHVDSELAFVRFVGLKRATVQCQVDHRNVSRIDRLDRDGILSDVELRLVHEGRNDVDDLPENIGFDLPLEQTTLPQNFGGKSGGLL